MSATTLITDVNVFDRINEKFLDRADVVVESNKIKTISTKKIEGRRQRHQLRGWIEAGKCRHSPKRGGKR